MPSFNYKARDKFGKLVSGTISAPDKGGVAKHLSSMGYIPISIDEVREFGFGLLAFLRVFNTISLMDINIFTRQLLTLQKAGVPLLGSLDTIERQTNNKRFKETIRDVGISIEHGLSLSSAMERHPKVFNDFYVNMVRSGEASGLLDEILERLLEFGEKEADNRAKIKAAIRYPLITLGALAFAFFIIVTFVIPKFSALFGQFKTALPLPTIILLRLSFFLQHYWLIVLFLTGVGAGLFSRYIHTVEGRFRWDGFKLKVPIFGTLISMFAMSRFTRTMSILMRSGLPILQVLDMASKTSGNAVISRAVDAIALSVKEGKGISEPMKISGIFPPIVVDMVAIGEDTGKIDELLMSVSEYYDQQSDYLMKNLTTTLEPAFVLLLGIMVLTMALAIFLPMWNLTRLFRH